MTPTVSVEDLQSVLSEDSAVTATPTHTRIGFYDTPESTIDRKLGACL